MGQKLFGLVSPRGDFMLKTTLHGWAGGGLVVNGWQYMPTIKYVIANRKNLCLTCENGFQRFSDVLGLVRYNRISKHAQFYPGIVSLIRSQTL